MVVEADPNGRRLPVTDAEQCVMMYMEALSRHLGDQRDFALLRDEGRFWQPQTLPRGYQYGQYGDCFRDAARLAMSDSQLRYCEGYGFHGIVATHHAWCVDVEGRVIDRVWRIKPRGRLYAVAPSDCAYFGIRFKRHQLRDRLLATGRYGMLFDWLEGMI